MHAANIKYFQIMWAPNHIFIVIGVWRRRKPILALKVSEISAFIQERLG